MFLPFLGIVATSLSDLYFDVKQLSFYIQLQQKIYFRVVKLIYELTNKTTICKIKKKYEGNILHNRVVKLDILRIGGYDIGLEKARRCDECVILRI